MGTKTKSPCDSERKLEKIWLKFGAIMMKFKNVAVGISGRG